MAKPTPLNFGIDEPVYVGDGVHFELRLFDDEDETIATDGTGFVVVWRVCVDKDLGTIVTGTVDATNEAIGIWLLTWDSTGQPPGLHESQVRVTEPTELPVTYFQGVIKLRDLC